MVNDIANASGAAGSVSQVPAPSSAAAADEVDLVDVSSEPLLTVVGLSGSRLKLKTRALPSIKVGWAAGPGSQVAACVECCGRHQITFVVCYSPAAVMGRLHFD
jgi:hypothetical protein